MTIAVYIDSCARNYLQEKKINLLAELPPDIYKLFLTREVEIEIEAIPENEKKKALKDYIRMNIENAAIKTTSVFGFQTIESLHATSRHSGRRLAPCICFWDGFSSSRVMKKPFIGFVGL